MPGILSRGYGRRSQGVVVAADREGLRAGPRETGDEPLLLARRLPGVPVVVGESRHQAGQTAVERCAATALVLDDGFQHRTLAKDVEVVVLNGRRPWGNGHLFPRGTLREPQSALGRASLALVTNPGGADDVAAVERALRRYNERAPLVTGAYQVAEVTEVGQGTRVDAAELRGVRLLAFAGLAAPKGFAETLRGLGIDVAGLVEFPDHHWYDPNDLVELERRAREARARGLATTEKDAVRLEGLTLAGSPIFVVSITLELDRNEHAWHRLLADTWNAARARA
jgi:tetraacyldisaccharide 4'-kinase